MMMFTSIYGVVDGFFVSNYVGGVPFAALNLVMPYIMVFSALGFMIGTGGSALVAFTLGTGDRKKANEIFSLLILLLMGGGVFLSTVGWLTAEPVSRLLGATEAMLPYCVQYARISFLGLTGFMLQNAFQGFLIAAEKPKLGLWVTVAAGVTNMVLDWLLMGVLGLGLGSAAAATALGECVGGCVPLIYFLLPNRSLLRLGRTHWYPSAVWKSMTNGSSELVSTTSVSLVNMLINFQLMRYAGQNGVSAFGIIMYTNFLFMAIYFGYSFGVAPIVSYHFGAENRKELRNVYRKSMQLLGIAALGMIVVSEVFAPFLAMIFAGDDRALWAMTTHAIRIYVICYLTVGLSIFGSSFFTALNNGLVSAVISFQRSFIRATIVLVLPLLMGLDGVWISIVLAEWLSGSVALFCLLYYRKRYGYGK